MKIPTSLRSVALTTAGLVMASGLAVFGSVPAASAAETAVVQETQSRWCPHGTKWSFYLYKCVRNHGHHHGHHNHGHHHGHHNHGHHHGHHHHHGR